jgi:hypothetical protein
MLSFYGLNGRASSGISSGFVEFTTVGTNQSITSSMIPAGVTRVRVHLIGAGGGESFSNGGSSAFSAASVSVLATGGYGGQGDNGAGGSGGSVTGVAGIVGTGNGGSGTAGNNGGNGGFGIDVGIGMGGGGGGSGFYHRDLCASSYGVDGGGGQVGINGPSINAYNGGAGGGWSKPGTSLVLYSNYGGAGVNGWGEAAGGGGAYAMFYANLIGATTYTNAISIGSGGTGYQNNGQNGYCRIEWGPEI